MHTKPCTTEKDIPGLGKTTSWKSSLRGLARLPLVFCGWKVFADCGSTSIGLPETRPSARRTEPTQ